MARKSVRPKFKPPSPNEHHWSRVDLAESARWQAKLWVPFDKREFERTKNPIFVWKAIGTCLAAKLPIPWWARDYLLTVARNLSELRCRPYEVVRTQAGREIARWQLKAPGPKQIAPAIASAMGFMPGGVAAYILKRDAPSDDRVREKMGRYNPFRIDRAPSSTVAAWVDQQRRLGARLPEAQASAIREFGISKRTVERACSEHRSHFKHRPAKK